MERARGITIFSKQAAYNYNGSSYTLLDTPGHVDFSAETERTLWVLDAAVLVISGMDGVEGIQRRCGVCKRLGIPVFIFVNKMDQQGTSRQELWSS
ncbi:MAG: GTP-binding protein [Lachnospira eligens]